MRVLLTGHKGYIGGVAVPMLLAAGHEVTGLDTDLYAGCDFGGEPQHIPELRKDMRDITGPNWKGSRQSCIWRRCRMILWAI